MNRMRPNGYRLAPWAPAAPRLSQQVQQVMVAPTTGGTTDFLESPSVAILTDLVVGSASAFYAWGLGLQKNKMSTFWWVIAGASGIKLLHDLSRLE